MTEYAPVAPGQRQLGLAIDLDTCVGCQACVTACRSWNDQGQGGPLAELDPYGAKPEGAWLNRVHSYEVDDGGHGRTVHFPRSCLHCAEPACVTVCPTGASYKRQEDGIVLVDAALCIGCGLCAWACPYGARELDPVAGVMRKCTLCVDRIYNEHLPAAERQPACVLACPTGARHFGDFGDPCSKVSTLSAEREGTAPMLQLGYRPVNRYLPPRAPVRVEPRVPAAEPLDAPAAAGDRLFAWLDRVLSV